MVRQCLKQSAVGLNSQIIKELIYWSDNFRTLYYCDYIDFSKIDFTPNENAPEIEEVKKIYNDRRESDNILEMRCPSGLWQKINLCPRKMVQKTLASGKNYLFRIVEQLKN